MKLSFSQCPRLNRNLILFGLSKSTHRGFIKNKAQLVKKNKSCSVESVERKRNRKGSFPGLEKVLTLKISSKNV